MSFCWQMSFFKSAYSLLLIGLIMISVVMAFGLQAELMKPRDVISELVTPTSTPELTPIPTFTPND